jgi:hypothetical protein
MLDFEVVSLFENAVILLAEAVILCIESIKIPLQAFEILLQSQVPFVHEKREPSRVASSHFDAAPTQVHSTVSTQCFLIMSRFV